MAKQQTRRRGRSFRAFWIDDRGGTALEYAFIGAMVSVSIIAGLTLLGTAVNQSWTFISNTVATAMSR